MKMRKILKAVLFPLLLVAILSFFLSALSNLSDGREQEDKKQLESALTRAAVACYAVEGAYPPNVQYLEDNYGIQINKTLYTVKYEVIASNLMPDITVLENDYEN